jgi:hypothetical protein
MGMDHPLQGDRVRSEPGELQGISGPDTLLRGPSVFCRTLQALICRSIDAELVAAQL